MKFKFFEPPDSEDKEPGKSVVPNFRSSEPEVPSLLDARLDASRVDEVFDRYKKRRENTLRYRQSWLYVDPSGSESAPLDDLAAILYLHLCTILVPKLFLD